MRRKAQFANDEFFHIYNRGVDKRRIFNDKQDVSRFVIGVLLSNDTENTYKRIRDYFPSIPIIDVNSVSLIKSKFDISDKLVNIYAYSLLPNHFHFILQQNVDNGISTFMNRLQSGYSRFFNYKKDRSGALFQGPFKSSYIYNDEQLKKLIAYVSNNNKIHKISVKEVTFPWNSLNEYIRNKKVFFEPDKVKFYEDSYYSEENFDQVAELILEDRN